MGRGSLQIRHRQGCSGSGSSPRLCSCSPTVYGVFYASGRHRREKLGYLEKGWKSADVRRFEDELAAMRNLLEAGKPIRREAITLATYAERWFEDLYAAADAGRVSKLTYNKYEGDWTNHLEPAFGHKPMVAIDAADLRTCISRKVAGGQGRRRLAPATANATLTPLSAMFTDALAAGLVHSNPAQLPRRGRHAASNRTAILAHVERKAPKHLEPHEAIALLAATPAGVPWEMVLAALTTGFRRGELLGIRWTDVDWGRDRITLRHQLQDGVEVPCKNHSARDVVLYSGLRHVLGRRRQADGYVFTDPAGEPWTDDGPRRAFLTDAYKAAGLYRRGIGWHTCRHTYVSVLSNAGVRDDVIAMLAGHKRQGTTARYSHPFADAAADVDGAIAAVFGEVAPCNDGVTTAAVGGRKRSRTVARKRSGMRS